jgi:virginiamycin B lyase
MPRLSLLAVTAALLAPACSRAQPAQAEAASPAAFERRVFDVPSGAHPHDAAPGPPGQIWYTAQQQGALGIIDIASGKVRQVPLGPSSAPHGVIQAKDGTAWITDGGQNAIVRYDPKTEKIDVWKLPEDSGYTNLNTGAFAADGTFWFTGQNGIYGRVPPGGGKVEVFKDPDGRGPYGITGTPDGEIWYVSLAASHLAHVNRADGTVTLIDPPDANAGLRRVWSDSKGDLWISGWNSGKLYRYHPASGTWDQWRLPGSAPRAYAVYVDPSDKVWVSNWGTNETLRFDPATQQFTGAMPGSAADAGVRQILGRGSEVYLPESGLDRLVLVTVRR